MKLTHTHEYTFAGHILTTEYQGPERRRTDLVLDVNSIEDQRAYVQIDRQLPEGFNTAGIVLNREQLEAHRDAIDVMLNQFDADEGKTLANGA